MSDTRSKLMAKKSGMTKPHLGVAVLGHVDSGKSTLVGQFLSLCGMVDARTLEKYRKEAFDNHMGSYRYAWICDKLSVERARGLTINGSLHRLETEKYELSVFDAPGCRDFTKNLLTGLSQTDVGILVVSAARGEFEVGISRDGQTREHALLALTMGVNRLIVVVNKMDEAFYDEGRYDEVKEETAKVLKKIGFLEKDVTFVAASAFRGLNLTYAGHQEKFEWNKTPTLLRALDEQPRPERAVARPLRMPVQDVYKIRGVGTVVVGRVEAGTLRQGMKVVVGPSGVTATVERIESYHRDLKQAGAGLHVGVSFGSQLSKAQDLKRGFVIGSADSSAPKVCESFTARVVILNHPNWIRPGYTPVLDVHTSHIACKMTELIEVYHPVKGNVIDSEPAYIKKGDHALVRFVPTKPLCVEAFKDCPQLGRFSLRDLRRTVAVGKIIDVEGEDLKDWAKEKAMAKKQQAKMEKEKEQGGEKEEAAGEADQDPQPSSKDPEEES